MESWPVEPDAAQNIFLSTAGLTLGGGLLAGATGSRKNIDGLALGLNTARNVALTSFVFFSLREWLVTPSLRKYASVNQDKPTRSFKLTDSALAGAIGGGSWNYHLRGKAGVVPGILTAVVVCTAGQVAANEVRVQRINYILRRKEREEQDKTKEIRVVERPLQPAPREPEKHSWLDRFKFYRVPDEEYLNKLKDKSDKTKLSIMAIEQRMNELELLLNEEHKV